MSPGEEYCDMVQQDDWADPANWRADTIRAWISQGWDESGHLEFKERRLLEGSKDNRNKALGKAISAFANSDGGNIVLGVQGSSQKGTRARASRLAGFDPSRVSREWLAQIANEVVKPRVPGLAVAQVDLDGNDAATSVFVISVPKSFSGAHQAPDHKYYGRYDHESKPMEDWEVKEVSARRRSPELEIVLYPMGTTSPSSLDGYSVDAPEAEGEAELELKVGVINRGYGVAGHALFETELTKRHVTGGLGGWYDVGAPQTLEAGGTRYTYQRRRFHWPPPDGVPIFRTAEPFPISTVVFGFNVSMQSGRDITYVFWTAQAPEMTLQTGGFEIIRGGLGAHIRRLGREELPPPPYST